jgi:hypothetical protein
MALVVHNELNHVPNLPKAHIIVTGYPSAYSILGVFDTRQYARQELPRLANKFCCCSLVSSDRYEDHRTSEDIVRATWILEKPRLKLPPKSREKFPLTKFRSYARNSK